MLRHNTSRNMLFVAAGAVFCVAAGCHDDPTDRSVGGLDEDETLEPMAADSPAKKFEGTYRLAGESEKAARDRAIDALVAEMSVFSRGIARSRLIDGNPVAEEISIGAVAGNKLRVAQDDRDYAAPLDGQKAKVKGISGDEMDMHFAIGDELTQTFATDGRGKVYTYRIDGDTLKMTVRLHSDQLPKELIYELTYNRI